MARRSLGRGRSRSKVGPTVQKNANVARKQAGRTRKLTKGTQRKLGAATPPAGAGPAISQAKASARRRAGAKTSSDHNRGKARPGGRRRILIAMGALAIPALVASAFVLLHSALFAITSIRVVGARQTASAAVITAGRLTGHPPLIDVNPVVVATRVERLPWVKGAVVTRHWPTSVTITITERVPVAQASVAKHRWELFDQSGRVLGFASSRESGLVRLHAINPMPTPGESARDMLFGEVALADALPLSLLPEVREVSSNTSEGLFATLLGGTTAIFGSDLLLRDKMTALATLIANHVSLTGVTSINLVVPSSPVLSPPTKTVVHRSAKG